MTNVVRLPSLGSANTEVKKEMAYPLATGGDGGDSGGMDKIGALEKRVDKVEENLASIKDTLAAIRVDIASVKGRVDAMPTTIQLITLVFGILAGAFAIVKYGLH